MAVDLFLPPTEGPHPVLVYCHGFKGFKQWGHVPFIHEYFATGEYAVIAFNHSHNGVIGDAEDLGGACGDDAFQVDHAQAHVAGA